VHWYAAPRILQNIIDVLAWPPRMCTRRSASLPACLYRVSLARVKESHSLTIRTESSSCICALQKLMQLAMQSHALHTACAAFCGFGHLSASAGICQTVLTQHEHSSDARLCSLSMNIQAMRDALPHHLLEIKAAIWQGFKQSTMARSSCSK